MALALISKEASKRGQCEGESKSEIVKTHFIPRSMSKSWSIEYSGA